MKERHMQAHNLDKYNSVISKRTKKGLGLGLWVFNATFNNIPVISWRSVLLVEGIGVPENTLPVASH